MFDARMYTFCNDQGRIGSEPEVSDARFEPSAATGPDYAMTRKYSKLDFWPGGTHTHICAIVCVSRHTYIYIYMKI